MFSSSRKQHNNKESLVTDLFERLNFEQSFFKTVFQRNSLKNIIKNNLCKVSRRRARDRDRNPSRSETSKNGYRDASRDRDQVSRFHHLCLLQSWQLKAVLTQIIIHHFYNCWWDGVMFHLTGFVCNGDLVLNVTLWQWKKRSSTQAFRQTPDFSRRIGKSFKREKVQLQTITSFALKSMSF